MPYSDDLLATIARRVKSARDKRGWSQTALALKAGVSQKTISNLERAGGDRESLSLANIERVVNALGMTMWQATLPDDITEVTDGNIKKIIASYATASPSGRETITRIADLASTQ